MKHIITLITLFAGLAGCSEEPDEELERIVISALLNTTWTSECVIDVDGENSYLPTLIFTSSGGALYNSGNGSSSNIYYLGDTTCIITEANPEPETRDLNTFSYTLGNDIIVDGTVAEITKATEIDTVNTTEDSPDIGAEEYDIFAIKDKYTLYFGNKADLNNGTTVDLRPTQLSESVIFTR